MGRRWAEMGPGWEEDCDICLGELGENRADRNGWGRMAAGTQGGRMGYVRGSCKALWRRIWTENCAGTYA